jgi:hypothetical protein
MRGWENIKLLLSVVPKHKLLGQLSKKGKSKDVTRSAQSYHGRRPQTQSLHGKINVSSRLGKDREPLNNYTKCNYIYHLPYIVNKLHIKSKPKSVFPTCTTDTNQNSICESLAQWSVMTKNYLTVLTESP